jgi:two-component system nitrate/nitrite response regulator NarL
MSASSNIRILVVDDSSIWRTFIIGHLYDAGMRSVYVAYDGVQAVFKARTLQPDLILMDVRLPHMNGIDAASAIHHAVPSAKVVFLSGNSDPDVRQAALDAGGSAYVPKSLAGRQLIDAIKRVLCCGAESA